MKKIAILICLLATSIIGYSQTFSYTFTGKLSVEQLSNIESKCSQLNRVASAKIKYKEDRERGELLIVLVKSDQPQRAEADDQFSAIDVKHLLLNEQLSPLNFRKLND